MFNINKAETVAITAFIIIGFTWAFIVTPNLVQSSFFQSLIPPFQYILYNLGFIFLLSVFLGIPLSYVIKRGDVTIKNMLIGGLASFLIFSFVLDMWQPPLAYDFHGNVLITNEAALPNVAVDKVVGWVWSSLGISGSLLYMFVYFITPVIAIIAAALLLETKYFLKLITER